MMRVVLSLAAMMVGSMAAAQEPTLYGLHENVQLPQLAVALPAKLDTGAQTASLSATDIELFKRDGARWVRFRLTENIDADAQLIEKPLARMSHIKRRAGDREEGDAELFTARPVVELDICVGTVRQTIEMNLTDRSDFEYPVLLGSTALKSFRAAVDPSSRFAAGEPSCS